MPEIWCWMWFKRESKNISKNLQEVYKSPSLAVSSFLLTNMKWEDADPAWSPFGPGISIAKTKRIASLSRYCQSSVWAWPIDNKKIITRLIIFTRFDSFTTFTVGSYPRPKTSLLLVVKVCPCPVGTANHYYLLNKYQLIITIAEICSLGGAHYYHCHCHCQALPIVTWVPSLPAPENWVMEAVCPKAAFHILAILSIVSIWQESVLYKKDANPFSFYLKCVCGGTICFIDSTGTVWHKVAHKLGPKACSVLLFRNYKN